jgi:excisionase family DNA binding protein
MKQFIPTTQPIKHEQPHFLTRRQLARRWNCSTMTVRRRQADGTLKPYFLAGRDIRFKIADVEALEAAALVAA